MLRRNAMQRGKGHQPASAKTEDFSEGPLLAQAAVHMQTASREGISMESISLQSTPDAHHPVRPRRVPVFEPKLSSPNSRPRHSDKRLARRSRKPNMKALSFMASIVPYGLTPATNVLIMFSLERPRNVTDKRSGWQRQPPSCMRTWTPSMPR